MSETREVAGDVFAHIHDTAPGDIRVTDIALAKSRDTIRDLPLDNWAFGQYNSVLYDTTSRRLMLNTFDFTLRNASIDTVESNPAIAHVASIGKAALFGYIVDLSFLRSLAYKNINLDLDDSTRDSHRLDMRRRQAGTELVLAAIMNGPDDTKPDYHGPKQVAEQAAMLHLEVSTIAKLLRSSSSPIAIPGVLPSLMPEKHPPNPRQLTAGPEAQ